MYGFTDPPRYQDPRSIAVLHVRSHRLERLVNHIPAVDCDLETIAADGPNAPRRHLLSRPPRVGHALASRIRRRATRHSPSKVAMSPKPASSTGSPGTSTPAPRPVPTPHSASVTASPPSEQLCGLNHVRDCCFNEHAMQPGLALQFPVRRHAGNQAVHDLELLPRRPARRASRRAVRRASCRLETRGARRRARGGPTTPSTSVSAELPVRRFRYRDSRCRRVIGMSSARQAMAIPSTPRGRTAMLPKLRQLVAPIGFAPAQANIPAPLRRPPAACGSR